MRVNINGIWHDAKHEPIQIELTDDDKLNISKMHPEASNYIVFPDGMEFEEVKQKLNIVS